MTNTIALIILVLTLHHVSLLPYLFIFLVCFFLNAKMGSTVQSDEMNIFQLLGFLLIHFKKEGMGGGGGGGEGTEAKQATNIRTYMHIYVRIFA